jgi:hypothetical protein
VSRCTLDILGLAGFDYDFNTVKEGSGNENGESTNELAAAFVKAHRTDQGYAMMQMLYAWIPPLRWVMFDQATRASNEAQKTMRRIGRRLVEEKKRHLGFVSEGSPTTSPTTSYPKNTFVGSGREKDLLSLMIKANMSPDISPEQRMSDGEVMHQIPTFIVAGMLQLIRSYYTKLENSRARDDGYGVDLVTLLARNPQGHSTPFTSRTIYVIY